jgi:8-amino-7-oxononanoate synthase
MSRLTSELDDALERRAARGLRRERRIVDSAQGARLRVGGREMLHFGSNGYLGLAGDPRVVPVAQAGAARYGDGAGASHLISGHFAPHDTIERELAPWIAQCANARALLRRRCSPAHWRRVLH